MLKFKALNHDWHFECFKCEIPGCEVNLQEKGFIEFNGKLLCTIHYNQELSKKEGKPVCQKPWFQKLSVPCLATMVHSLWWFMVLRLNIGKDEF